MYRDCLSVVNEAPLLELVHEVTNPRPSGPDHGSQCVMRNLEDGNLLLTFFSESIELQKDSCQTLFY